MINDPLTISIPKEQKADSGDAFSASYTPGTERQVDSVSLVDQKYRGLQPGYVKRVLLTILDREEHHRVIAYHEDRVRWTLKDGVGISDNIDDLQPVRNDDPRAQIRITDMRLAADLRPVDLRRELDSTLSSLSMPFSADDVKKWKRETLRKYKTPMKNPSEWTEEEAENEKTRVTAVSFAAAALLLLHDLDMVELRSATHEDLKNYLIKVRSIISTWMGRLNASTKALLTLLRNRRGQRGKPADPEAKAYRALHLHRMGYKAKAVARSVGINPTRRAGGRSKGSKSWKERLEERLAKGVELEQSRFPDAVEVFARKDEQKVQEAARRAYDEYLQESYEALSLDYIDMGGYEDLLLDDNEAMRRALIQLGSCLENNIPPFSLS